MWTSLFRKKTWKIRVGWTHGVVRESMDRKQIQPQGISSSHLKKVVALGYDKGFKTLCAFMNNKNLNLVDSGVEQGAESILAEMEGERRHCTCCSNV